MTNTMTNPAPAVERPLLLDAKGAAGLLGIGRTKLYELHTSGRLPLPVRLGRCVRWDRRELAAWIEGGCPARDRWQAMYHARPGQRRQEGGRP